MLDESAGQDFFRPTADVGAVALGWLCLRRYRLDFEIPALRMSVEEAKCLDDTTLFDVVVFTQLDVIDGVNVRRPRGWFGGGVSDASPPEPAAERDASEEEKENNR